MPDPKAARWRQVDQLCGDALLLDPDARAAFLARACGDDAALRQEVEALVESDRAAAVFLERPALQALAQALAADVTSLVGQQIGGYRIESLLGSGGMGEVYRARDLRLERDVALKVLERAVVAGAGDFRRFEEEARAASGLNHPNIVTIYGVGEAGDIAYIAMELVHGRTLREILSGEAVPTDAAIDIAAQLADALAAAHASGIVHRDLKPDNVMVTSEGLVKVLDFGIAKRHGAIEVGAAGREWTDRKPGLTEDGVILGTAGYMSPEQAEGRDVDHRSDQFSLGAILYEVLSGRRAFERSTKAETIAAIIGEEPDPIPAAGAGLTRKLNRIVDRCLAKDPANRYDSTRDLAARLRAIREESRRGAGRLLSRRRAIWLAGTAVAAGAMGVVAWRLRPGGPAVRRLAVLPFANRAGDEDAEYLCDGLADSLIRRLSLVPGLEVKALSAVLHFKGRAADPQAIGRQLSADAVLTGSLTRRGGRLIVTAELVDVARAARLWGDRFDRPETDVLAVHDELAAAILRDGLGGALDRAADQRFARGLTTSPRAYDLYLQAVHHFRLQREDDYLTARELLTQAIAADRSFALAHVTLASTYSVMAIDGYEAPRQAWPQSTLHVRRALDLDADLPDAHAEASAAEFFYRRDWEAADREWRIVLESRRGEVQPELLSFRALQKWALGQNGEALQFARAAKSADPLSVLLAIREADVLARTGQLDAAAGLYEKIIRDAPDDLRAYFGLADVRRRQGRFDEAIDARRRAGQAAGDASVIDDTIRGAAGYARLAKDDALHELGGLRDREAAGAYVSPLDYARVHARLGDTKRAFEFLAASFEDCAAGLVFLRVDPSWDNIRREPKFLDAIKQVGLPAAS